MSSTTPRLPSLRRRAIASAVVTTILATGAVALGVGDRNGSHFPNAGWGWLGSFYVPGVGYTYCINPALSNGFNDDPVLQSTYSRTYTADSGAFDGRTLTADITPREAFEISYIIGTHGQLDAPMTGFSRDQATWAAAVELAVWDRSVSDVGGRHFTFELVRRALERSRWRVPRVRRGRCEARADQRRCCRSGAVRHDDRFRHAGRGDGQLPRRQPHREPRGSLGGIRRAHADGSGLHRDRLEHDDRHRDEWA